MKQIIKKTFISFAVAATTMAASSTLIITATNYTADSEKGYTTGTGMMENPILRKNVFNVVLPAVPDKVVDKDVPVSSIYDFFLDPNGVFQEKYPDKNIEKGQTLFFQNKNSVDNYDYSHISDALTIQNKSSMSVDIKLQASLTDIDGITLTNDNTFTNDKSRSVYLALSDDKGKISAIDKYDAFLKTTLSGQEDAYKIVYDQTAKKYTYTLKDNSELGNIQFAEHNFWLSGSCNTAGNWSGLPDDTSPKIAVIWSVSPRPDNMAPSIGKTSYCMSKNTANTVYVDLGAGNLAATSISSIVFKNSSGITETLPPSNYTFANDTLVFSISYIADLISSGINSRTYTIIFDDKAATKVNVTLNALDIAPSIEQTSYDMHYNQPVLVDINMGSGTLAATGIKSITFNTINGTPATLAPTGYSFADGTLTLAATHINNVLHAGITSRDYIITLNDKASTRLKVTLALAADGTAPSITTSSYVMERNKPISMDVDLGSESLEATGITSITFKNKAGTAVTLDSNSYNFTGRTLTFAASHINNVINAGITSREYIITFNNVISTSVNVTLTADNISPSIKQTSYTMEKDQSVQINIDLGSGNLVATDIKSISFYTKTGTLTTLSTSGYTFTNGILTLPATHINNVLKSGIASRVYSITLNDKAATCIPITLTADATAPSVETDHYKMHRGQPVSIKVDLGTKTLEATGINTITFKNKLGSLVTLPASNYSFANKTLTIAAEHINNVLNAAIESREYTITFNNIVSTQVKIALTADNIAPSITKSVYTMLSGQPVVVDIDLGSGNLAASGINSITFKTKTGALTTLTTNNYSFIDGKLTLFPTHINNVLNAGITSREYNIILNDKASTCVTITIKK